MGYNESVQTVKTDTTLVPMSPLNSVVPQMGGLFTGGSLRPRLAGYVWPSICGP